MKNIHVLPTKKPSKLYFNHNTMKFKIGLYLFVFGLIILSILSLSNQFNENE